MPEEDTSQAPAPTTEPTPPPQEAESTPQQPEPAPTETAHMGRNEPFAPEPEPFDSFQDKPTPEPPSAAASVPTLVTQQTGILHAVRDVLVKARATIQSHKKVRLAKILFALEKKNRITNDEVEKLLHVSDATATRYLSALEKEGKIKQIGNTGHGVVYQKI